MLATTLITLMAATEEKPENYEPHYDSDGSKPKRPHKRMKQWGKKAPVIRKRRAKNKVARKVRRQQRLRKR